MDVAEWSHESMLDQGIRVLADLLGSSWQVRLLPGPPEEEPAIGRGADAVLEVTPEGPSPYTRFLVDVKRKVSPRQAEEVLLPKQALVRQVGSLTNLLVITPWIAPRTQQILRDHGIGYLDLTGNVSVRVARPAIVIHTQGASHEPRAAGSRGDKTTLAGPRAGRLVRLLTDAAPPYRAAQLADVAGISLSYVSKLLDHLEDELLIRRDGRVIVEVDWPNLLRARAATFDLLRHNPYVGMLAPNGIAQVQRALHRLPHDSLGDNRVAVTGPYAAQAVVPLTSGGQLMLYVPHQPHSPDRIGKQLGLLRVDQGADVLLLRAYDEVVFKRRRNVDGIPHVALSQLVIDGLAGPGRMPAESEAVLDQMIENPHWRAKNLESLEEGMPS